MRMRIVMQLSGKMVSLFTRLWVWLTTQLWNLVSNLRVRFFRKYQSAVNLFNQLVPLVQKLKALLVNLITQVQSIKCVVTTVLTKVWAIGLQLVTIARQILQLVTTAFKKNKEPVDKTK
jgi:phage-related protein